MIKIIIYGALMFALGFITKCIKEAFHNADVLNYAEQAKTPNETIECTCATVLIDDKGNVSWFRNNNLNIIKKRKEDEDE